MPQKKIPDKYIAIISLCAVIGIVLFGYLKFLEKPRSDAPVGALTKYFEKKQIWSGVHPLTYYLLAPPAKILPGNAYPLVVILHGAPGNVYAPKFLIDQEMKGQFLSYIAVPVLPAGLPWDDADDLPGSRKNPLATRRKGMPDVLAMIKQISEHYPIDTGKIYVLGCSEGGYGAYGAIAHYPDIFSAAVAISSGWNAQDAVRLGKRPLLIEHGAADPVIAVDSDRQVSAALRQIHAPSFYMEFPDLGHDCTQDELYPLQMWQWLFMQKK